MSARILLVEDEAEIRDAVAYALRQDGFEVETAGDGERGARDGALASASTSCCST